METKIDFFPLARLSLDTGSDKLLSVLFSVLARVCLILSSRFSSNFLGECYTALVEVSVTVPRSIL